MAKVSAPFLTDAERKELATKQTATKAATTAVGVALSAYGELSGNVDFADDVTKPGSWSSARPQDHWLAASWFDDRDIPGGSDLANQLAFEWWQDHGIWPTVNQLLSDSNTANRIEWTMGGYYALPPTFGVRNEGGGITYYSNSPKTGLKEFQPFAEMLPHEFGRIGPSRGGRPNSQVFNRDDLDSILGAARGLGSGRRGSGSGRGSGPAAQVFDRDQLIDAATQMWQGYLIEDPTDVGSMVDAFVDKSNAFLQSGGRLDFETFILGKIRESARYKMLYAKKPEAIPEQQWVGQYVQAVAAVGLPNRKQLPTAAAGATAGLAIGSFEGQLTQRADVQAANQGTFSQRFAAHFSQLGLRGT